MPDYNDLAKGAPTFVMNQGPQDYLFWDDFNRFNPSASATSFTGTGGWSYFSTDSGNTAAVVNTASGGQLALTFSTPTDEDVIMVQAHSGIISTSFCKPNTPIRFGCRFKFTDVDSADVHIGLSIFDNSMAAGAPADWVGFRVLASEASGEMNLVASKGSVVQMVDPVTILADDTWVRAFFEFVPVTGNTDTGTLYYTVHQNGNIIRGSLACVNTFPDNVWIAPMIQYQIEGTDGDTLAVDWIYLQCVRNDYTEGTG